MNIVRRLKARRREAEQARDLEGKLAAIPQSSLCGTSALPTELWGQILDSFRRDLMPLQHQCHNMHELLKLRLVCRLFDRECVQRLHQTLTIVQIPFYAFMRSWTRPGSNTHPAHVFCNALLASAIQRSALAVSRQNTSLQHLMAYRIRNCVLIARCIDQRHDSSHRRNLTRMLCNAASTSRSCWAYIFTLRYDPDAYVFYIDKFGSSGKQQDIELEAALLVACGYKTEDVKRWMMELGKRGKLYGYRGQLEYHKKRCRCGAPRQRIDDDSGVVYDAPFVIHHLSVEEALAMERCITAPSAAFDAAAEAELAQLLLELESESS